MKQTSNNKLNYPGHIDCRNSSLTDKLEWESELSVKLRAFGRALHLRSVLPRDRSNLNSNYLVEESND